MRDESPIGAVACVASVSVWFRNKKRTRNDEELDFWSSSAKNGMRAKNERGGEGKFSSFPPHPLPVLLLVTFFARSFDTHSLFFAPKRHGNTYYADYRARAGRGLVSGSEGFAVYGSLLIMSLRGGVVGTPLYKQEP